VQSEAPSPTSQHPENKFVKASHNRGHSGGPPQTKVVMTYKGKPLVVQGGDQKGNQQQFLFNQMLKSKKSRGGAESIDHSLERPAEPFFQSKLLSLLIFS